MLETTTLLSDAAEVAQTLFEDRNDADRLLGVLRYSVSVVDRLTEPRPDHEEWRRIAVIVQLLVCTEGGPRSAFVTQARRRLAAFIDENADLLDFATRKGAFAFVN